MLNLVDTFGSHAEVGGAAAPRPGSINTIGLCLNYNESALDSHRCETGASEYMAA